MDSTEFVAAEMEMAAMRHGGSSSNASSSSSSSGDSLTLRRNNNNNTSAPASPSPLPISLLHLPPPPPGVERVSFNQEPMGITVMTTPDEDGDTTSLVVTNVQVYRI